MHWSLVNSIILSLGIMYPSRYGGMNAFIYFLRKEIHYWLFNELCCPRKRENVQFKHF